MGTSAAGVDSTTLTVGMAASTAGGSLLPLPKAGQPVAYA